MGRVRAPRWAALVPVAVLVGAALVGLGGAGRVASADPVPAGQDPGRLAYVAYGEHHSLQLVGIRQTLSPYLAQGLAGDDCEPSARGSDVVFVSDRGDAATDGSTTDGDTEGIYRRTGEGPVTAVLIRPGWRVSTPKLSPDGQWIVFASFESRYGGSSCLAQNYLPDQISLWLVHPDGTGLKQLAEQGSSPDWSPDGTRVAYVDGQAVKTVSVNGGAAHAVSPPDVAASAPAWSPDGSRIAYVDVDPAGNQERLRVVSAGGDGEPRTLATGEIAGATADVAWSPDGRQLAFLSGHAYLVDQAGTCGSSCENTRLLPDGLDDGYSVEDLTWYTPDGGRPAVLLGQEDPETVAIEGERAQAPVDRLLLRPPLGTEYDVDEPAYSPDGGELAFTTTSSAPGDVPDTSALMVGPADHLADAVPLRTGFATAQHFGRAAWSPDGTRLAVAHWGDPTQDPTSTDAAVSVFDVSAGPAAARLLLTVPWPASPGAGYRCNTDDRDPAWSPDGGRLAFSRYHHCTSVIHIARADGGTAARAAAATGTTADLPAADGTRTPRGTLTGGGGGAGEPGAARAGAAADGHTARAAAAAGQARAGRGGHTVQVAGVEGPALAPMITPDTESRHIMTIDADSGARLFDVTATTCGGADCSVQDARPAYRPDGGGIAFVRRGNAVPPQSPSPSSGGGIERPRVNGDLGYDDSAVLIVRTDGTSCHGLVPPQPGCPLTPPYPADDAAYTAPDDPAWSPTGDRLAVDVRVQEGDGQSLRIAVLDPDTGAGDVLPAIRYSDQSRPTWQASTDLTVTATGPAAPVLTGATTAVTLHVTNRGIADSPTTAVDLTLPPGLVAVGTPATPQGTCTAAPAPHCDLDTLPVGATVDVTVTVRPAAAGTYPVSGRAAGPLLDRQPQDNTATVNVVAVDPVQGDPAVSVTVAPPGVLTGDPATVTYTVTNRGDGPATGVALTVALPPGVTVSSANPACPDTGCALGDLAPGASVTVTRVVTSATALSGNVVGTVSSTSPDADKTNNTATAAFTVRERPPVTTPPTSPPTSPTTPPTAPPARRSADPAVTLTLDPATAYAGGPGSTARVTVRNLGHAKATGILVALAAPPGVTPDPAAPCATAAGCPVADLDPGGSATVTVALATPAAASGTVTVNLSTTGTDSDTRNDTASATLTVKQPVVTLVPTVGPPGAVTQALGRDFPPGAVLDLRWSQGVTVAAAPVKVASDGTFSAPMLVLVQDTLGPRQLLATDRAATPRFGQAHADYLVVPGVLQPSHFKWRR